MQNYTIPLLGQLYDLSKVAASSALSGYMIASAVGMAAGGFLVSANPRTERTVMVALILAGLTLVVLALGLVPAALAAPVVGLAGFCSGVAAPSRDMLIRRVTPKGATGSVYGLVYSGMDVGSALAAGLRPAAGRGPAPGAVGGRGRGFRRRGAAGPVDRGAGAPRRSGGGRARAVLRRVVHGDLSGGSPWA